MPPPLHLGGGSKGTMEENSGKICSAQLNGSNGEPASKCHTITVRHVILGNEEANDGDAGDRTTRQEDAGHTFLMKGPRFRIRTFGTREPKARAPELLSAQRTAK